MNYKMLINPVVFLQVKFIHLFMKRHNLSINEFIKLDKQKDIIGYLRDGYENFHLTGDEGVLLELDKFIFDIE